MENLFELNMTPAQVNAISNLGLAHIGDGVYELLVRSWLCAGGNTTLENLHKKTVSMVKAPAQAAFIDRLLPHLTDEEAAYYRRGKNAHVHAVPKGATREQYANATGLEALFGARYLLGRRERCNELFHIGMQYTQ